MKSLPNPPLLLPESGVSKRVLPASPQQPVDTVLHVPAHVVVHGLHRLVISHDYTLAQDELDQGAGLRGEIEGELEENTATHASLRGELDEMTAATEGMMKDKAAREGGELKEITLQEASASKVLVELNSKFTNKDASVKEEEAAIAGLQKQEVRKKREEKGKGRERER